MRFVWPLADTLPSLLFRQLASPGQHTFRLRIRPTSLCPQKSVLEHKQYINGRALDLAKACMKRLGLGIGLAYGPVIGVSLHYWRLCWAYTQSWGL